MWDVTDVRRVLKTWGKSMKGVHEDISGDVEYAVRKVEGVYVGYIGWESLGTVWIEAEDKPWPGVMNMNHSTRRIGRCEKFARSPRVNFGLFSGSANRRINGFNRIY